MASGAALALVAAACVVAQVVSPSPASAAPFVPVIAAGASHSCQIQAGHASCWGDNSNGELGNNSTINSSAPVPVYTGGVLAGLTLTQITVGTNFTCALASTGTPYCWGLGTSGQLGDSFSVTSSVPVRVSGSLNLTQITSGAAFSCGVTSAGVASCWGLGTNGQLGNGLGTTSNAPVTVSGGFNLAQIAAGGATACALSSTSVAYCWGAGASGQLGNGSATSAQLAPTPVTSPGATLTQITVGTNFACALAGGTGLAYCWGSNANGQLGTATTPNNVPVAVTVAATALVGVTLTQISAGGSTTCALAGGTGLAYCWGAGGSGQLGNGFTTASQGTAVAVTPGGVLSGVTLTQVSAGTNFACAVASKGAANCWGANGSGQLGNPATAAAATVFDVPVAVTSEAPTIAAGNIHSCMLRNGKAYCWGDNTNGELGNNSLTSSSVPVAVTVGGTSAITAGTVLTQIAAGNNYTCALSSAGKAYCWGASGQGQLGVSGSLATSQVPVAVTVGGTSAITAGTVLTQISTGNSTCALSSAGAAYCWGADNNGQLGNNTIIANSSVTTATPVLVTVGGAGAIPAGTTLTQVSVTSQTVCALSGAGRAYCWGYGGNGEMGNGGTTTQNPLAVLVSLAGVPFIQVSAGYLDVCALSSAGADYCWGGNTDGGLGNGSTTQSTTPLAVTVGGVGGIPAGAVITQIAAGDNSNDFACAMDSTGAAYCWGYGVDGQLGNSTNTAPQKTPVPVTTSGVLAGGVRLAQITAGQAHVCAMDSTGAPYCWGDNTNGDLGNGNTTGSNAPVIVLPGPPTSVAAFPGNTTATVYWVAPVSGMLGTDTVTNYTVTVSPGGATCTVSTLTCTITGLTNGVTYTVTVVTNTSQGPSAPSTAATVTPWPPGTIATGKSHSCTIFSGKAYCWGDNTNGELGIGTSSATPQPTPVAVETTGVLNGKTLTQIGAGQNFTCALDSAGVAYCWGLNSSGQLGNNNLGTDSNVPVLVTTAKTFTQISVGNADVCAVDSGGLADCWGDGTFGQLGNGSATSSPVPITVTTTSTPMAGKTIVQISAGYYHSCALDTAGVAYCWGSNNDGQLGITINGLTNPPVTVSGGLTMAQVSAGNLFSCGLTSAGAAYCWGLDSHGQLGNGSTTISAAPVAVSTAGVLAGKTMTQLSVISNQHACAVDSTGTAYCWGLDSHGQLGDGTVTESHVPVAVVKTGVLAGTTITQISTGYQHNCVQDAAGTAYCWGINDHGQLGNNNYPNESHVAVFVAPQGPTGVSATPGDTTAAISWTAPVFLNNGTITGYTAAASPGGASCSTTTATLCTISGLTDGTVYTITVTVTATTGTASGSTVTVTPVGFLTLTSPSSLTWAVTGNGVSQSVLDTVAADQQFTATDNTGAGLGWHITVSATTFTNGTHTLPNAGAVDFTGSLTSSVSTNTPSVTCVGSCTISTDTTTYPVVITTAASSPTIYTIYSTPGSTGLGVMTVGGSTATNPIGWWVQVPGSAYAGTYTTTVSLEMISGP